MTEAEVAAIARQARCFVHPILIGSEADRAVDAITAWQAANPDATADRRERAWARITQLAC
jgi:hypothetical protein